MLPAGTSLGPYIIVGPIGSGGMGEVYRAHDPRLGREIALKVLPHLADADMRRRFESEARAASALSHPNIVVVHDIGEDGGVAYIAMELVEGQPLRAEAGVALPLDRLLGIAVQIVDALRTAHARGVAHRDLKPENVLITSSNVVKVVDFGLAKLRAVESDNTVAATQAGLILGTPGYMAPEQARGLPSDVRSDQFAFGALLYELATGRRAFHKASPLETAAATLAEDPTPISTLRPDLPAPLVWIIQRCLAKDPAARYDTTEQLYGELAALRGLLINPRPAASLLATHHDPGGLIGRNSEADRIVTMLQSPDVHWVTLTGAGGVGKTTLARLVASRASRLFAGAIVNVALSPIADAALVVTAVAEAVGAQPRTNESPAEAVLRWLRERQQPVMLILDNFEHVAIAAPDIARLVRGLPGVKVLATSRAVLHVSHEHEFVVEGLDAESALLLFTARAQAVRPEFRPGDGEASDIAALCDKLGRLPLAIELAAARVKVVPPKMLLGRLEGRLLSLTGGALDRPERQQTLRATVEWSFGLLTPEEQRLFRRLGVFAGSWTLDAAEAVCDARQDLGIEIIDGIASLLDNSLITRVATPNPNAEPRFTMLEILREYATERLEAADEMALFRRAHAAYCLVVCEEAGATRDVASQQWLAQCDSELANIRAACAHLVESGSTEWALRIANSLLPFWQARGLFVEAESYVRRAIGMADATHYPALRAKCFFDLLSITHVRGDYATAIAVANRTIEAFEQVGDTHGVAVAHNAVGIVYRDAGKYEEARRAINEAIRLWREHGHRSAAARAVSNLASTELRAGRYEEARRLYAECRELFSLIADEDGVTWSLQHEGDAAREAGDQEVARGLYADAHTRFTAARDDWGISAAQTALGDLALDDGDTRRAMALFTDALATTQRLGSPRGVARLLDAFARTAAAGSQHARALRLAGAASALRQQLGVHLPDNERRALDSALSQARRNEGAAAAYLAGSAMSADQAIAYATGATT